MRSFQVSDAPASEQAPRGSGSFRVATHSRVLVVDDEELVRKAVAQWLNRFGFETALAADGRDAVRKVAAEPFDVILSDISMPGLDGLSLLRAVREHDLNIAIVLMTGAPALETAMGAIDGGAFGYLTKPIQYDRLGEVVSNAVRATRFARWSQQAAAALGSPVRPAVDRTGLDVALDRAIAGLWIAYQPIVDASTRAVFGFETLMRSHESALPNPDAILAAAEALERLPQVGDAVRRLICRGLDELGCDGTIFVNLHPHELGDSGLTDPTSPLSRYARNIVLEITERARLLNVREVARQVGALREIGYRIAIDDLGAGYAALSSFAELQPEFVKLDMSLVQQVDTSRTAHRLIAGLADLSTDLGVAVISEGVETRAQCEALIELGCRFQQGYYFARPGPRPSDKP